MPLAKVLRTDGAGRSGGVSFAGAALSFMALLLIGTGLLEFGGQDFFHGVAEFFCIALAISIFLLTSSSRDLLRDSSFLILGAGFLCVGALDYFHIWAFPRGGISWSEAAWNLSGRFWMGGRLLWCLTLAMAIWAAGRRIAPRWIILGYAMGGSVLVWLMSSWSILPVGSGAGDEFARISSWVDSCAALVLLSALGVLAWRRAYYTEKAFQFLVLALILGIVSQLSFTQRAGFGHPAVFLGHCFRTFSFFAVYLACMEAGVLAPHRALRRSLELRRHALQEGQLRLQLSLDAADAGTWVWDARTGAVTWSARMERIFGLEPGDFAGTIDAWRALVWHGERPCLLDDMGSVLRDGRIYRGEFAAAGVGGARRIVEIRAIAMHDEAGEAWKVAGICTDITAQREAEHAHIETGERLRAICEVTPDAVILVDEAGEIVLWNGGAERMFGYDSGEAMGRKIQELIAPPRHRTLLAQALRRLGDPDAGEWTGKLQELTALRRDGSEFFVEVSAVAVTVRGCWHVAVNIRDVSQRKAAEAEERLRQQRMAETQRMSSLGVLVAGLAHEINNPNHFIMLSSSMLEMAWEDIVPVLESYYRENGEFILGGLDYTEMKRRVPELLDDINEGAQRISFLVSELRDFAHERGPEPGERVDLNEVVRLAAVLMTNMLKKASDQISVSYDPALPQVSGSFRRLEQVVINLLRNACEALSERHGALEIETRYERATHEVVLSVRDEGAGIAEEDLHRVEEPFFTTRRASGASGLGLSVSATIVREHGGRLEFRSRPGEGTVAVVRLPAEPGQDKLRGKTDEH